MLIRCSKIDVDNSFRNVQLLPASLSAFVAASSWLAGFATFSVRHLLLLFCGR
jgi:hypothetical protein